MTYPGCLGDSYTILGTQTLAPKKTLFKFSFFSCTSTKNMFSYFGMANRQKCRQKSENESDNEPKRRLSERRNRLWKSFHSFKYVIIDHANIRFFFLIFLRTCSHSSNDINSLPCGVLVLPYYLLHLFSSDRLATLVSYSHKRNLFEYMNLLKIFLKEE